VPQRPIRLIATDVEGTLLRDDRTISDYTRTVLHTVREAGIAFVLVTARPPRSARLLASEFDITGLAICCNGALVYDLDHDTILSQRAIAPECALAFAERLRATVPDVVFACEVGLRYGCEPGYAALRPPTQMQGAWRASLRELCAAPVTKLLALHPLLTAAELLSIAQGVAEGAVTCTRSDLPLIEVSAAGVDKGSTLAQLCASLNITADDVVAFGDMPNDLAMLAWAGYGVAVANADPLVLAVADALTGANNDDGVAVMIAALLALPPA
jgi:Cof subfamily protein (haloacid dehalogenase superfamily)